VPGAPAPYIDTWAPAQWVFGSAGAAGPVRSPEQVLVNYGQTQNYDTTLHWKVAGTIIMALVTVFVLQALGFRFVVAAGVGG